MSAAYEMSHQVLTNGRFTVFTGTLDQCEDYMTEVGGKLMGYRIDRVIVRCKWCRWPIHEHCCKTREDQPKDHDAQMARGDQP